MLIGFESEVIIGRKTEESFLLRQPLAVSTLGVIGGLAVLLMVAVVACNDDKTPITRDAATPASTNAPTLYGVPTVTSRQVV